MSIVILCNFGGRIISGFKVIEEVPSDAPLSVARRERSLVRIWLKGINTAIKNRSYFGVPKEQMKSTLTYGSLG